MVTQYIATRPILELCKKTVRRLGVWFYRRWWDQEGLDLAGARAVLEEAVDVEDGREVE